jgi:glycosyl transferase family 25
MRSTIALPISQIDALQISIAAVVQSHCKMFTKDDFEQENLEMNCAISYVCISLAGAHERRALMAKEFEKAGIEATFFTGIEPRIAIESISEYDHSGRMRRYGRPLTRGEIGCYLSHREVWKSLVHSGDDVWCVMEDDLFLRNGFRAAVEELAEHREHWDIVRLMGLLNLPQLPYAELPSGTRLMWMDKSPNGAQCYVITREAA